MIGKTLGHYQIANNSARQRIRSSEPDIAIKKGREQHSERFKQEASLKPADIMVTNEDSE